MIYFTSDLHFNHDRAFIYEPRGFHSIEESNKVLFDNWNSTVAATDTVYMLGDLFMGDDLDYVRDTLPKLNGWIHIIRGNHDTDPKMEIYRDAPNIMAIGTAINIKLGDRHFYLSHYPTITANLNDNPQTAVFNLHGHIHSRQKFYEDRPYMYNVAVDAQNNRPVSLDQVMHDIDAEIEKCLSFLV